MNPLPPIRAVAATGPVNPIDLRQAPPAGPVTLQPPAVTLQPAAVTLLAELPAPIKPNALAAAFPRIVNLLAQRWPYPPAVKAYLDELLFIERENRQGFPLEVLQELIELKAFYHTHVAPDGHLTLWNYDPLDRVRRDGSGPKRKVA